MAGYERFLSGMEIPRYQGRNPQESKKGRERDLVGKGSDQESKREEAKIGKVEWQDMKDSYLVWKYRDTRVGILQESKRERRQR